MFFKSDEVKFLKRENKELRAELNRLRLSNDKLIETIERQSERYLAAAAPTSYANYLVDKNTTDAERQIRSSVVQRRNSDIKGLEELGILSNGIAS